MTSISSFLPIYSNAVSSASQLSSDQALLSQLDSTQNQNTADNVFGGAYSLSLSNSAFGALSGDGSSDSDSSQGILSALTYSNYSTTSQGSTDSINSLLSSLTGGNSSSATDPFSDSSLVADGGPLPAFLTYVDSAMHLNGTQQQALQQIATHYQNADDTPQTVASIAGALQQAGIPETI